MKIQLKKRILILCEDEKSSLLYFKGFKKDEEFKRKLQAIDIEVYHPHNYSPVGLFEEAKEKIKKAKAEKNPYDETWLVFDKDGHQNIEHVYEAIRQSKSKIIKIAISNICFEYWVLLHFEYTTKGFKNYDEIEKYLNKKKYFDKYAKKDDYFPFLKEKLEQAINHNKKLFESLKDEPDFHKPYNLFAYTNIFELIKSIILL